MSDLIDPEGPEGPTGITVEIVIHINGREFAVESTDH